MRKPLDDEVREVMRELQEGHRSLIKRLTGLADEEIDDLGGLPDEE